VGAVLLHDQEDVLDRGRGTDARRNRDGRLLVALGLLDVVLAPAVLLEDGRGVARDVLVARQGEAGQGRGGAVRVVAGHAGGSLALAGLDARTARVDAASVGDDDLLADGRYGRRVVVGRQQADVADRVLRRAVVLVD